MPEEAWDAQLSLLDAQTDLDSKVCPMSEHEHRDSAPAGSCYRQIPKHPSSPPLAALLGRMASNLAPLGKFCLRDSLQTTPSAVFWQFLKEGNDCENSMLHACYRQWCDMHTLLTVINHCWKRMTILLENRSNETVTAISFWMFVRSFLDENIAHRPTGSRPHAKKRNKQYCGHMLISVDMTADPMLQGHMPRT